MTRDDVRDVIIAALRQRAPEADPNRIDSRANLRDELDLDSMDFLNVMIALHERLGVDIPEADYGRLLTLHDAVEYLVDRIGGGTGRTP